MAKELSLPIRELFALGSELASSGNPEERNTLYENVIYLHPDADKCDRFRVDVNRHDQVRRKGDYEEALDALQSMEFPERLPVRPECEHHAAVAQCLLRSGDLSEALSFQLRIVYHREFQVLDLSYRLYALEGALSMSIKLGNLTLAMDFAVQIRGLVEDESVESGYRSRTLAMLHQCIGHAHLEVESYRRAANSYMDALDACDIPRYEAGHAWLALYCVYAGELTEPRQPMLEDLVRERWSLIEKTKAQEFREAYNVVCERLVLAKQHLV